MTKLRLSPDLTLPDDVVTSTLVIYGGKGMGKTNLGSVLVEELTKARLRWCLLDPMGVSWGLRHSKDGKGPGIECVILGGAHGDIPIEPTGGAIVADLVVDENVNTIIDFSRKANGEMWSIGEKVRFVTEYTLRLFRRQGELVDGRRREPIMQILDEAARYIPQTIPSGAIDLAKCVGAWEQVVEEGRNIGLGVCFLTQRSARMNKSVSELADVMFAFRTIGPNSLNAIMDWLGEHVEKARLRDLASQVRELSIGQALLVSPGWLRTEKIVQIRERETFDSSATPKAGQRVQKVSGSAAKPDLAKYHAKMAATIEKVKADDPKELRKRIAQLEKEVAAKPGKTAPVADPRAIERAVKLAVQQERDALDAVAREFKGLIEIAKRTSAELIRVAKGLDESAEKKLMHLVDRLDTREARLKGTAGRPVGGTGERDAAAGRVPVVRRPVAPPPSGNGASIGKGARVLLTAIAQHDSVDREQLTVLTGYKRSSRDTYLQRLQAAGLIVVTGSDIRATDDGVAHLGSDFEPLPTGARLRDYWLNRLTGGEEVILRVLCDVHGEAISRDALSEQAEYKRSSRDTYLQRLAARKLITVDRDGVRASDILFDGVRR